MSLELTENKWKENNKEFINDLNKLCPNDPNIIKAKVFMEITPVNIQIKKFIEYVMPHKEYIKKEDDKYFLKNLHIFDYFGSDVVNLFKSIWTSNLNVNDRKSLWAYFNVYIAWANNYIKKQIKK